MSIAHAALTEFSKLVQSVNPVFGQPFKLDMGLDFDGTLTADPVGWGIFVKLMRARGHKVHIVTMRYPSENKIVDKVL